MKVIINRCFGGWSVSRKALDLFNERSGKNVESVYDMEDYRSDPILVDIVRELDSEANGSCAKLRITSIPDEYDYWIEDYDGMESVHLRIREDHLRSLIQKGIEDDIVRYVMKAV